MWVAFALQKLLTFFQQKISAYLRITRIVNESLTNNIVSFEQLGPDFFKDLHLLNAWMHFVDTWQMLNTVPSLYKPQLTGLEISDWHYENTPIQIYWKFHHQIPESFQIKILIFFLFLLKT